MRGKEKFDGHSFLDYLIYLLLDSFGSLECVEGGCRFWAHYAAIPLKALGAEEKNELTFYTLLQYFLDEDFIMADVSQEEARIKKTINEKIYFSNNEEREEDDEEEEEEDELEDELEDEDGEGEENSEFLRQLMEDILEATEEGHKISTAENLHLEDLFAEHDLIAVVEILYRQLSDFKLLGEEDDIPLEIRKCLFDTLMGHSSSVLESITEPLNRFLGHLSGEIEEMEEMEEEEEEEEEETEEPNPKKEFIEFGVIGQLEKTVSPSEIEFLEYVEYRVEDIYTRYIYGLDCDEDIEIEYDVKESNEIDEEFLWILCGE